MIKELKAMVPSDQFYEAKVIVLMEYIKHHVKEDESEMFPEGSGDGAGPDGLG